MRPKLGAVQFRMMALLVTVAPNPAGGSTWADAAKVHILTEGEIDLQEGNGRQAVRKFSEANRMLDTWIGHFQLGVPIFR